MSHYLWHFSVSSGHGISSTWDGNKINKMAQIMDLPLELLNSIITMLAMSPGGFADLSQASAICKVFMTLARHPNILRVVNFENFVLVGDCEEHRVRNSLLYRCARAGNLAAEFQLGKAVLLGGTWGFETHDPAEADGIPYPRLLRSFVLYASSEDIVSMQVRLFNYLQFHPGSNVTVSDIFDAVRRLGCYEHRRSKVQRVRSQCAHEPNNNALLEKLSRQLRKLEDLMPPPGSPSHRDRVLMLLDELFPQSLV